MSNLHKCERGIQGCFHIVDCLHLLMFVCRQLFIGSSKPIENQQMMALAFSSLMPSDSARAIALPTSAITNQTLDHIGAQFYDGTETSNGAVLTKAPGFNPNTGMSEKWSSNDTMLGRYLQTANRAEIFLLGRQSSYSARVFDTRLIIVIDGLVSQIEATATGEAVSAGS